MNHSRPISRCVVPVPSPGSMNNKLTTHSQSDEVEPPSSITQPLIGTQPIKSWALRPWRPRILQKRDRPRRLLEYI